MNFVLFYAFPKDDVNLQKKTMSQVGVQKLAQGEE